MTNRQEQIVRMVAGGWLSKQIAGALGLSVRTVETHRFQAVKRLGLNGTADLVRWAVRNGMVRA